MNKLLFYREELLNSLCSSIDDLLMIIRLDNLQIEYISPNLERLYNISINNFKRNPFLLFNRITHELKNELNMLFVTDKSKSNKELEIIIEHPVTKQDNTILLRIYPVFHRDTVTRYVISVTNTTKEKKDQELLREALVNAQEANNAKRDFLSHIGHEIKTHLNSISGMSQIANNSIEDRNKVEHCLDKISFTSKNLVSLVNNILDMSRIDSNKLILIRDDFELDKLLYEVSELMGTHAEIKNLKFDLDMKNINHCQLIGDSLRLYQILQNCISNSLKFTPPGGNIRVIVDEQSIYGKMGIFSFTIIDNGKGMSEEYLHRIFVPFEQEDLSISRIYGGTGLGMSITKNLITLMNGDIHVSSKLGEGTTITINIPFEIRKKAVAIPNQNVFVNNRSSLKFSGCNILVAEDNEINIEVIKEFLHYAKIRMDIAKSGAEVVKLFESSSASYYDIIFMDIQMPELNGYEAAINIRKSTHSDSKRIPIVAMSADSGTEEITKSMESGMNYYLAKPIDMNRLYELINQIINY